MRLGTSVHRCFLAKLHQRQTTRQSECKSQSRVRIQVTGSPRYKTGCAHTSPQDTWSCLLLACRLPASSQQARAGPITTHMYPYATAHTLRQFHQPLVNASLPKCSLIPPSLPAPLSARWASSTSLPPPSPPAPAPRGGGAAHLSQAARMSPEDLFPFAMLLTVSRNSAKASRYLAAPSASGADAPASPPKPSWSGPAVDMPKTRRMRVTYAAALRTRNGCAG